MHASDTWLDVMSVRILCVQHSDCVSPFLFCDECWIHGGVEMNQAVVVSFVPRPRQTMVVRLNAEQFRRTL